jgi:hypothetical protein
MLQTPRLSPWEVQDIAAAVRTWASKHKLDVLDGEIDAEIVRRLRALMIEPSLIDAEFHRVHVWLGKVRP